MSDWKKGRYVSVKSEEKLSGDRFAWGINYYEGDDIGYHQNDVIIHFGKDGHLFLVDENSNGGSAVYLYPSQAKKLRGLLRNTKQPAIPKFIPRKKKKS